MLTAPDRRVVSRRAPPKIFEPLQRVAERREEERRDGPRVPREVTLIDCATGDRHDVSAFLSLEGLSWTSAQPLAGDAVEVLFRLPDLLEPQRLLAQVTRVSRRKDRFALHARFPELHVKVALALARFLEDRARLQLAHAEP